MMVLADSFLALYPYQALSHDLLPCRYSPIDQSWLDDSLICDYASKHARKENANVLYQWDTTDFFDS